MDGMNVKSLEERSEGDVASPSSTGTQVQSYTHRQVYSHGQVYYLNSQDALVQDRWGNQGASPTEFKLFILYCLVPEWGRGGRCGWWNVMQGPETQERMG